VDNDGTLFHGRTKPASGHREKLYSPRSLFNGAYGHRNFFGIDQLDLIHCGSVLRAFWKPKASNFNGTLRTAPPEPVALFASCSTDRSWIAALIEHPLAPGGHSPGCVIKLPSPGHPRPPPINRPVITLLEFTGRRPSPIHARPGLTRLVAALGHPSPGLTRPILIGQVNKEPHRNRQPTFTWQPPDPARFSTPGAMYTENSFPFHSSYTKMLPQSYSIFQSIVH
jgi:hypothetical protein